LPGLAGWGPMKGLMQYESRLHDYEEPLADGDEVLE
jgi:hypothetical protein